METKKKLKPEKDTSANPNSDIQDLYTIFTSQCINLLAGVEKNLASDPKALADVILGIITKVESESESKGIQYPLEVILKGGSDLITVVFESKNVQADQDLINQTCGLVVGKYLDMNIKTGKITPEQIQQMNGGAQNG
jgi:tRNA-binding EMAP/Myf-like protein